MGLAEGMEMFDFLGPIGAIQSPNGQLEFGNVGVTNCVYFSFKSEADSVPTVIYNPDELADLIKIIELAGEEITKLPRGASLRIGSMAPKPITLRVALVHPHQQAPFLLLRLLQGNWSQDITCTPQTLLQLLKTGQVEGPEPLAGPLMREEDGTWLIDGEKLELLHGLSPGRGDFGEYVHPDEVKEGTDVEVWPLSIDGRKVVATFRYQKTNRPSATQNRGQTADSYLARGHNHLARTEILKLAEEQLASGKVTAPWAAKASLTYLLAELADGDDQAAQQIWLGRADSKFLQMGSQCIEAGQSSNRDLLIYHQISAYFHSLNPEIPAAAQGVNQLMTTVCRGCAETAPEMLYMALCNWYLFLKEVYEGDPPADALTDWSREVQARGWKPSPKVISFPNPDTWEIEEELVSVKGGTPPQTSTAATPPVSSQAVPAPPQNPASSIPPEAPDNTKRFLMAVVAVLLVCLALSSLFVPRDRERSTTFTGKPEFAISGISLDQSWDEIDGLRKWEDRQKTILSSYLEEGHLTVRFDAEKNIRFIDGQKLSRNGQTLFTSDTEFKDVLSRFGEPSERNRDTEVTYVYDDAGQKCVVTMNFEDRPSEFDPDTGREIRRGRQLEKVRLSLAGQRWEKSPSLPLLSK